MDPLQGIDLPAAPVALLGLLGLLSALLARNQLLRAYPVRTPVSPAARPSLPALGASVVAYLLASSATLGVLVRNRFPEEILSEPARWAEEPSLLPTLLGTQAAGGLAVALVAWAWARSRDGARTLGLGRGRHGLAAGTGCVVWGLCLPLIFGLGIAWQFILLELRGSFEGQAWANGFGAATGAPLVLGALLAVLVVPFLEEVCFRGFLQPMCVAWMGVRRGVTFTALVFALLHGVESFAPIFCLALLLGWLRQLTGSLWAAVVVHVLHNGLQVGLLVVLSGL